MSERDLAEFEAQTRRNKDSRADSERSERRRESSRDRHKSHRRHHRHRDDRERSRERSHRHHSRSERDHHSRDHRRSRHNRDRHDRHDRESERRRDGDRSRSPVRTVPEPNQPAEEEEDEEEEWVVTADTGEFYDSLGPDGGQEHQPVVNASELSEEVTVSRLNKLKAEIMKAETRGDRFVAEKLQSTYDLLVNSQNRGVEADEDEADNGDKHNDDHDNVVTSVESQEEQENDGEEDNVKVIDRRFQQTRPKTSGEEMTVQDMLREELETRGTGDLLGKQLASRIGRDSGFDSNDLDYQDERAGELAQVDLQKSEQAARNSAIARTQQLYAAMDLCPLCWDGIEGSKKLTVIAHGYHVVLAIAPIPTITKGVVAILPKDHKKNTLECDDDEWEEIRNFMKSLAKMWYDQGKGILFYESAIDRSVHAHACIMAVPVPLNLANTAPGFFRESIMAADDEWSDHQKIIDTAKAAKEGKGRLAFRTSIAKQAPYFHVWFNIDGGYGHIVENARKWPPGDLFAREVIGGMLQADPAMIKQLPVWKRHDKTRQYLEDLFMPYDWTEDLDT